ncbi:hypothetical protein ACHAWF_008161, partial [Thalassiosira exigua]
CVRDVRILANEAGFKTTKQPHACARLARLSIPSSSHSFIRHSVAMNTKSTDTPAPAPTMLYTADGVPLCRGFPLCCRGSDGAIPAAAADGGDGGPSRRVDCRPPQLLSALPPPQASPLSKAPLPAHVALPPPAPRAALELGPTDASLTDDDDDETELFDYFGAGAPGLLSSPEPEPEPAADDPRSPPSTRWNVRERNVPTLPSFYPLEASAVFVPQASAPVVANRIAAVLQARSVAADYDSLHAKVDCVSKRSVEFRIRLYRGRGDYKHGIIVEIQRRWGFDPSYAQDMYAILDAAEGKTHVADVAPAYSYEETDASEDEEDDEDDFDFLENSGGLASLRVISEILCPDDGGEVAAEEQDFALASLSSLTRLDSMGQAAVKFSRDFLESEDCQDLRRLVFSHVGRGSPSAAPQRRRTQSLDVLANVAESCQSHPKLVALLSPEDQDVIPKLTVNIANASADPRAACLSCVILKSIFASPSYGEGTMLSPQIKKNLMSALDEAIVYGAEFYAELEINAQQCMGYL